MASEFPGLDFVTVMGCQGVDKHVYNVHIKTQVDTIQNCKLQIFTVQKPNIDGHNICYKEQIYVEIYVRD